MSVPNVKVRRYLRPPIHAACHDNLRHELFSKLAVIFPLFEQRKERKCEPIRPNGICVECNIKVLLFDRIEIGFHERFCGGNLRSSEFSPIDAGIVEKDGDALLFALAYCLCEARGLRL